MLVKPARHPRYPISHTLWVWPHWCSKPGATIASIEFAFRGANKLHQGELVRAVNKGFLLHMDVFGQVRNVSDAKKAIALLKAGKDAAANKLFIGGGGFAGPLSTGGLQQLVVTAKPGVYVQGFGGCRLEDICAAGPDGGSYMAEVSFGLD